MRWSSMTVGWVACLAVAASACGDAGSGGGMGRSYGYTSADSPNSSFNDPPGSWNEPAGSFNQPASCGTEQVIKISDLVDALYLPVCAFVDQCFPHDDQPAQPAPGVQPSAGELVTLAGELFPDHSMSDQCEDLLLSRLQDGEQYGSSADCMVYAALASVVKTHPACDVAVVPPRGVCLSMAMQCARDIMQAGCAALANDRVPVSCAAFNESSDDDSLQPDQPNNP